MVIGGRGNIFRGLQGCCPQGMERTTADYMGDDWPRSWECACHAGPRWKALGVFTRGD